MAASSSTVTITEYPSLYTETAWVHTHGSESNEEVPVVMGKREWSGMWGGGLRLWSSSWEMMDGLQKAGREAQATLCISERARQTLLPA